MCVKWFLKGGIQSHILFSPFTWTYIFSKTKRKKDRVLCWRHFGGTIGYAGDNALLDPSIFVLKQMLIMCEEFAAEYSVTLI